MIRLSHLGLILLSAIFLLLLSPYLTDPVLYSTNADRATSYHINPQARYLISQEKGEELYSTMQYLLDAPQSVVYNLRIKEFSAAKESFAEYYEKSRYFDNLVVNLELSETAVGDFQRQNRVTLAVLQRMINESARLEEINRLETQYRNAGNLDLLYTITYEGEAVQQFLSETGEVYSSQSSTILEISQNLGLETESYEDSMETVAELITEREQQQQTRRATVPQLRQNFLTLAISPTVGIYGDVLQVTGTLRSPSSSVPVTVFLDSQEWRTVNPDENGIFREMLPVGTLRAGVHFIYGSTGSLISPIISFTINPSDTTLTLDVRHGMRWNEVICSGTLSTSTQPVAGAPIGVYSSGGINATGETSENGTFSAVLTLPEGTHKIQAAFYDPEFPLNSSTSPVRTVTLYPWGSLLLNILVTAGFILLFSMGGIYYLRQPKGTHTGGTPGEPPSFEAGGQDQSMSEPAPGPRDVLEVYGELLDQDDWSGAAHHLYCNLMEEVALRYSRLHYRSMTPREVFTFLADEPVSAPIAALVSLHEEIRYGGIRPAGGDEALLSAWRAARTILREGYHE